jgi:hypothetical protein
MVTDFGFLLPWPPERLETHSIAGLYAFSLPVGLACWWMFQRLIKPALLEILPDGAYLRCIEGPLDLRDGAQWVGAAGGVFFGAVSHLVWDGFTHEGARGVRMIPALDDPVVDIAGHHLLGFKVMQLASSAIGLGLVIWYLWRAWRNQPDGGAVAVRRLQPAERHRWCVRYAATTCVAATVLFFGVHWRAIIAHAMQATANGIAIAALRGLAFALIAVSASLTVRLKAVPAQPVGPAAGPTGC